MQRKQNAIHLRQYFSTPQHLGNSDVILFVSVCVDPVILDLGETRAQRGGVGLFVVFGIPPPFKSLLVN